MRFVLAFVVALAVVKAVLTRQDCRSLPGELLETNREFRHFVCKSSSNGYFECDFLSVKVLKIQNCAADSIDLRFNEYRNVRTLDISFSNYKLLKVIPYFENAIQLIASNALIEKIDSYSLSGFPNLEVLDLNHNEIQEISSDAFRKTPKLKTLNLKNNPIRWLGCNIMQLLSSSSITSITMSFEFVTNFDLSCANTMEWKTNEGEIIFRNAKTRNELRYPKINFKNLVTLSIRGNRLQNALDLVNLLGESTQEVDLSGNHLGQINESSFLGLSNLGALYLSDTNLSFTESNPFEHLNRLSVLDISNNNLRSLNVRSFSKTLNNLIWFAAAGNRLENVPEIVHSLGPSLTHLDLSNNFIGTLKRDTFERFANLLILNLSNTHLEHFDVNPLKVSYLDISQNNLKRLNVELLSNTLNELWSFNAAGNQFENAAEIVEYLGLNLQILDLAGSYVGKLRENMFQRSPSIFKLGLRRTNLVISDLKPFESLHLSCLDISNNNLTKMNFAAPLVLENFEEINLSGNHLTQLDGLTKHSYPKLGRLNITNNEFNCSYITMFRKLWRNLEVLGDPCERNSFPEKTSSNSFSVLSLSITIGAFALIIDIMAFVV